ncbi:hypothetical protein L208DRAFT_1376423 [Tricholoma matsutake]|nr:hypothetical protein L208DRAFT_1376423 [Tricholoma matsutake 945]
MARKRGLCQRSALIFPNTLHFAASPSWTASPEIFMITHDWRPESNRRTLKTRFLGSSSQNHGPGVLKVVLLVWIVAWNSSTNGNVGEVGVLSEVFVPGTKDYSCKVGVRGCLLDLLHNDSIKICNKQLVQDYNMGENHTCERGGLVSQNMMLRALLRLLDGGV